MDKTPIYKNPASYARENNELPQYRASMQSLARCKAAIEAVISEQWTGMGFPDDAAKGVLKEFGPEKVSLVLSYTVREKEHDKRISGHNRDWAKMVLPYRLQPGHSQITLESHSAKLDIFLDVAQKNILEMEQEKKAKRSATRRSDTKRKTVKPSKEPIYKEKFAYAQAHDECAQYNTSMEVNVACKDAIESAIREHYADNCFDSVPAVHEVVKQFGYDRMLYVLANSIQRLDHDGRISRQNIKWAWTVPVVQEKQWLYIVTSHPGLLNIFAQTARHEHLLSQPLKRADIKAEASRILEQLRAEREPNSPSGTHFMAQVSPDFLARANTKDHDRLIAMLPFASLSLTGLNDRKGIYALITKDENRSKPLILRKPSVRKKLQEPSSPSSASGQRKVKNQER